MIQLRDFLASLPDKQFEYSTPVTVECGTAFCIGGWARKIFFRDRDYDQVREIGGVIGLSAEQTDDLFYHTNYYPTRTQSVAVLDHYLTTGEIDWSAAK